MSVIAARIEARGRSLLLVHALMLHVLLLRHALLHLLLHLLLLLASHRRDHVTLHRVLVSRLFCCFVSVCVN